MEYFEKICLTLPITLVNHFDKNRAFSVEKKSDKNMKDLKECIVSTLKSQDHWGKNIPEAWSKIKSVLMMKRRSIKMCNMSSILDDLNMVDDQRINNDDEFVTALMYFHDTRVILFRKDSE